MRFLKLKFQNLLEKNEKSHVGRNPWHKNCEFKTFSQGLNTTRSKRDKIATTMAQGIQKLVKN